MLNSEFALILKDTIGDQERMFIEVINNNLSTADKASLPKRLLTKITSRFRDIQYAIILINLLNDLSETLHMTKKEILIKFLIDGDPQLEIEFANIRDSFDDNMRVYFDEACNRFIQGIRTVLRRLDR